MLVDPGWICLLLVVPFVVIVLKPVRQLKVTTGNLHR